MNYGTLGDRIKYHRKRLGMTQEQLAERMRVSAQAVSKWENNLSCPDISVLPELAGVFGISVDELLGRGAAREAEIVEPEEENDSHYTWNWKYEAKRGGILFAFWILTVGVLLLLRNVVPGMDISWWTILWTTALIYIGISGLIGHFSLFCLVMTLGGLYFLLSEYKVIALNLGWSVVIPAVLILWGISLLLDVFLGNKPWKRKKAAMHKFKDGFRSDGKKHHLEYSCLDGVLKCSMSFGEDRVPVVTPLLKEGTIESSFGDFTVDFSGCEAVASYCEVEAENSFGSLKLLIPEKFRVELEQNASFAASPEVKGTPAAVTQGTIHLRADLSFGSLQICYI
ncbi:MAG: helix-turn-helix transcriptional regulator [Oscillospiraceae bacterium]|nr:helix-turn-helix transcriptional regulator [Oscillospiraceae bacterium]